MLEHPLTSEHEKASLLQQSAKKLLIRILQSLPEGHLTLQENGHTIGQFGDADSTLRAHIDVQHPGFYIAILTGGSVAAGESYIQQHWQSDDVTQVVRLFARNLPVLDRLEKRWSWLSWPMNKFRHWQNKNSTAQAKKNIAAHYDIGNRLYSQFLDDSMMYSAAIYPSSEADLAQGQQHKLKTICDKLQLTADDHLLEIGTGWGGLAIYAARNYGCKVTTTTISDEQYHWAKEQVIKQGLQDKITLLTQDYRKLTGQYDKLVSIEMIEAVGKEYLPGFFRKCDSLLKPGGQMLLQAITINDQRYQSYANGVDFIQRYIFPGGFLPSVSVMAKHVCDHTDMMIRDLHDIGLDYARTLQHWRQNFLERFDELRPHGFDDQFRRLWLYYFCYCEGGFLERTISTVQLQLTKDGHRNALHRC